MEGKAAGIFIAILIACGVVWYQYSSKGSESADMREVAAAVFETMPDYAEHQSDYEYYLDLYHEDAFENNYSMGSRRRSSSFDEGEYWNELLNAMITTASADKKPEVAENLTQLRLRINEL